MRHAVWGEETGVIDNQADSIRILLQNYPNPFKDYTVFHFFMPTRGRVTMSIFDMKGKQVITILDQEIRRGSYMLRWKISGLSSRVYYYRLKTPTSTAMKKMTLMN